VASTLVVCGGLPLLAWAIVAPGGDPLAAPFLSVCPAVEGGASHAVWTSAASIDSPDSDDDDDDGGDDAPGGSSVAIVDPVHHLSAGSIHREAVDVSIDTWISRTPDGVSLRGPPSLSDDDDSLTDNDDDDDDSDDSDQLKALRTAASTVDAGVRAEFLASHVPARTASSPTLGHALRAPPERAL
jgi:hypothetical protein